MLRAGGGADGGGAPPSSTVMTSPRPAEVTVVFTPTGVTASVEPGTSLLDAARQAGADLDSTCGGRGLCGRCQVAPSLGDFPKWGITADDTALNDATSSERNYRGRRPLADNHRLGCQAAVSASLVVDIPPASQVHRPVIRKAIDLPDLTIDPLIHARYTELIDPQLGDERSDLELLREALRRDWDLDQITIEPQVLPDLHPAVVTGHRAVTAVMTADGRVIAVRPGFDEALYGVAVDVGSTTIAGYLVDLSTGEVLATAGVMNPQIRFGEDLMSRVSYVMMNPGGERELTATVRQAVNELIADLTRSADPVDPAAIRTRIHDVVLVGNPVMHHLLLGIDPTPLGAAPFTLTVSEAVTLAATELELDLPRARAFVGPCIAGHVGADAAAASLNERTHYSEQPQLLVDVGTNAEIVLGAGGRTFAASSPTGPAFEGAQISCGMRATAGAIERIRIDRSTLNPRFRVIGADAWSDEPAFADQTRRLTIAGLCGSAIIEAVAEMYLAGICDEHGVIGGDQAERSARIVEDGRTFAYVIVEATDTHPRLAITQNDIRQIQLAGAALRAGIDLLLAHAGVSTVADIRLAGAFGAHIDPLYALVLGLVPDCPVDGIRAVGNASGAGAVRLLVSAQQRAELAQTVHEIEKIETATEPQFQDLFVAAMAFPHATAPSPHLAAILDLPAHQGQGHTSQRRRRRR